MKVTFDNVYNAFQIIAPKGTMISFTGEPTALADGVYLVGDDGIINLDEQFLTDTLYLSTEGTDYAVTGGMRVTYPLGDETVIIRAGSSTIPFSKGVKGGGGSSGDNTHYKGTTTTPISNGSTTNPITIDGESYTAVFGDIVVYGYTEFVFDGSAWSEFGRPFDTTPTSGSANAVTSDGIKTALDTKQNTMQYTTMPTITASMLGKVVQYIGTSDSNYKQGWNYVAVSDGEETPTYSWQALMDSVPTNNSYNPVTSHSLYWRTPISRYGDGGNAVGGWQSQAAGNSAFAYGSNCKAQGNTSVAFNSYTTASGNYSAAMGQVTTANQAAMTAIGKYNSPRRGDLFNVGNGTSNNNRSNILEANDTSFNVNGDIQRDGVGIDDYTTTERKIGKWIDGSDLYQRTFEVTGIHNDGTYDDNILGTSNIVIRDWTGYIQYDTGTDKLHYPIHGIWFSATDWIGCWVTTGLADLAIHAKINTETYTLDKAVITIKYTKLPEQAANLMQVSAPTEEVSDTPTVEEDDMR